MRLATASTPVRRRVIAVFDVIVRSEPRTNRASRWRARAVSLNGHVSGGAPGDTQHTRAATARLIKWLPLISGVHMKGLWLLHDRFCSSSPRDSPRYTRTDARRKTMYHMYSLILAVSANVRARRPYLRSRTRRQRRVSAP